MLLSAILMLLPLALTTPLAQSDVQCGSDDYSPQAISDSAKAACDYVTSGTTAGRSTYPHQYNDREGFSFSGVPGPYYEFPIMADGKIYDGGKSLVSDYLAFRLA
jgi:ribonuclease